LNNEPATYLAADIGGTKSDFGLFRIEAGKPVFIARQRFRNADYVGVADIFQEVLAQQPSLPEICCCDVAGPVLNERGGLTNLPWVLDARELEATLGLKKVVLINDMTALCRSLVMLEHDDLVVLQAGEAGGEPGSGRAKAVLAPGTGLGEGFALVNDGSLFVQGAEGGHCSFAPVTLLQQELLEWMLKRQERVSFEDVASGPAVGQLYAFLREKGDAQPTAAVEQKCLAAADKTPVILNAAVGDHGCPLCRTVLELFLEILGAEAGNLALKICPDGGLYLGGGILPRLYGKASFAGFLEAFSAKSKMAPLLRRFPVYLILRGDAPLLGAAGWAMDQLKPQGA